MTRLNKIRKDKVPNIKRVGIPFSALNDKER